MPEKRPSGKHKNSDSMTRVKVVQLNHDANSVDLDAAGEGMSLEDATSAMAEAWREGRSVWIVTKTPEPDTEASRATPVEPKP